MYFDRLQNFFIHVYFFITLKNAGSCCKMADVLVFVSAFLIMAAFLALAAVIFNLGVLERRAMMDGTVRSPLEIPEQSKIGVENPFIVEVREDSSCEDGFISIILRSSVPCYMTFYWGVDISSIEESLCKDRPVNDSDDEDYEDQFVPVHRILSGSYESKGPMDYYEPGQDHQIKEKIPSEMFAQLKHDGIGTSKYQLLVSAESSRDISHHTEIDPCEIVSLLTAIKCKQLTSGRKTFVIAAQFIQIANGRIYPLKKLYVTTDDTEEPANESPEHTSTCVVCHSMPVSRVLLPCRHACVCGLCFSKLDLKCPMCRQWIQSYFLTQEEPELASSDLNTSRELHNMTLGEIVRGIFTSS